ncbi:hypothetical protein [Sutcliffiella deserti]|uniref:hypothetical protein n=1 Tax=Sutcliffiella deserti TaxID=2875501 RepID=UPI001CBF8931|nr:hypothetical protein [Sutcliffiella deserti]
MNKKFEIKILKQFWLGPPEGDLCSHGEILLRIGDTVLSNEEDGEWNISESALSLLRSVKENFPCRESPKYYPEEIKEENYLIFHCGCFTSFCPSNIGWKVRHTERVVELLDFKKNDGEIDFSMLIVKIPLSEYAKEIYNFAIDAKEFFLGNDKRTENNELYEGQYHQFWKEYEELLEYVGKIE